MKSRNTPESIPETYAKHADTARAYSMGWNHEAEAMKTPQLATLAFYAANPGWHSFDRRCRATVRAVNRLAALGFLEIFAPGFQARFTGKVFSK